MAQDKKQTTDHANGEAAAGTKELSKGGTVDVSAKIEDGGASGKGYKQPELKDGAR
jgi:hypothetical protein